MAWVVDDDGDRITVGWRSLLAFEKCVSILTRITCTSRRIVNLCAADCQRF